MLTRRDILALQSMVVAGAFAGRPFDLSGFLGGTAAAAEHDWDAGDRVDPKTLLAQRVAFPA